jgi:very-short-patch-repair endonuclease
VLAGHEVTRGGQSWLEREYLRLLADAGLPRPDTQSVLSRAKDRLVRVDCRFPGTQVVVELLGYQFHRSRSQMSHDATRSNALLADGFLPYQFTYAQVVSEQSWVVETTRAALARRAS